MNSRPGPDVYNPRGTPYGAAAEWDPTIASLADLASVATSWLQPPVIRGWVQASDTSEQVWQLLNSTAATVAGVSQRPNDYNSDNQKVWFKAGGSSYALPIASNSVLGGIKVGANLSIDGNGVLNAAAGGGAGLSGCGAGLSRLAGPEHGRGGGAGRRRRLVGRGLGPGGKCRGEAGQNGEPAKVALHGSNIAKASCPANLGEPVL